MRNPRGKAGASEGLARQSTEASTPNKPTRQARWQSNHPQAVWAWQCLRSALKRGLIKKRPCEVCGSEKVDAHHTDYSRPLHVTFLCRRHHREIHRKQAANG